MENQLDIRIFLDMGVQPFQDAFTRFVPDPSLNIPFEYDVKVKNYVFSAEEKRLVGRIEVRRYLNGTLDSIYIKEEEMNAKIKVDYFGNEIFPLKDTDGNFILDEEGKKTYPTEAVMTEWDRLAILFNAPIPDGLVLNAYKAQLFYNGKLFKP